MGASQHRFDARHENIEAVLSQVEKELPMLEDIARHQAIAAKILLERINYLNSNL